MSLDIDRHLVKCLGYEYQCERMQHVVLSGRVRGAASPRGLRIDIVGYSPAYHRSMVIHARADARGVFRRSYRPDVNLIFVAAIAPRQQYTSPPSRPQIVLAIPHVVLQIGRVHQFRGHPREVDFGLFAAGPLYGLRPGRAQAGTANRAWFYVAARQHGLYRRIGSARFVEMGWGVDTARFTDSVAIRYTRLLRNSHYAFGCTRGTIFEGMGLTFRRCGDRTLRG